MILSRRVEQFIVRLLWLLWCNVSYIDGYKGNVKKEVYNMLQDPVATSAGIIVVVIVLLLVGLTFAFKGSVHF